MNIDKLKEFWLKEEEYSFKGWDFSHINDRTKEEELPWNYRELVSSYMSEDKIMLDMGTGGGEFLMSLNPQGGKTYATESYPPNIKLSRENLAPLGIEVRAVEDDTKLAFEDEFFDLIINRHESYNLEEVNRILKPGGVFITQQVGEKNNREMSKFIIGEYPSCQCEPKNLKCAVEIAEKMGWKVLKHQEFFIKTYFYDIGAFVYFAKVIEWEFPGFSVEKHFTKLLELQRQLDKKGYIYSMEHRYILIAKK